VLLNWPETEKVVLGNRQLPAGYGWVPAIGLGQGTNNLDGEKMETYRSSYGWSSTGSLVGHTLTIAVRSAPLSPTDLQARSAKRSADRRWSVAQGFAVDRGEVVVDLPTATIRVSGSDRIAIAEYMTRQYQ
jgi:hypothetical protein